MYAKWIHPKRIVLNEGQVLRHNGRIVINPTHENYLNAGYFPVVLEEGQTLTSEENIYIVKDKKIVILKEEKE